MVIYNTIAITVDNTNVTLSDKGPVLPSSLVDPFLLSCSSITSTHTSGWCVGLGLAVCVCAMVLGDEYNYRVYSYILGMHKH